MRHLRRNSREIRASIDAAVRARDDANERLTVMRDLIAVQKERARSERVTIIAALRRMRSQDNLARMLLDTVEREAAGNEPGALGSGAH
jgi:hypothetical protein